MLKFITKTKVKKLVLWQKCKFTQSHDIQSFKLFLNKMHFINIL